MTACEWIIYRKGNRVGCVPVGSKGAKHILGIVVKSFYGTEKEAIEEARRLEGMPLQRCIR